MFSSSKIFLILILYMVSSFAWADDIQPSYLAIQEGAGEDISVLWKRPLNQGVAIKLELKLPTSCQTQGDHSQWTANGYFVESWTMVCAGGLVGNRIEVAGLNKSLSGVLVRIERADGRTTIERLSPARVGLVLTPDPGALSIVKSYLFLGIEHILQGWDHLLFVLCIMMLVGRTKKLFWAITAFTIAHSVTLVATTLGYIQFNTRVVEVLIALSIVLLAYEIVRSKKGMQGLSARYPWLVIFVFGLLHGVGFAGALNDIGLPHNDVALALLFFNMGVEIGQILFISMILVLLWIGKKTFIARIDWNIASAYCIGIGASYWFFERLLKLY